MIDLVVEYYNVTYPDHNFRRPFGDGPENSIIIRVKMSQFGRCRIGSEIFGSKMSSRHVKNSFIIAKFIMDDDIIECYPGNTILFYPLL